MSFEKRMHIFTILTFIACGIQLAIMLVGVFAPDVNVTFLPYPWYAWAIIADIIVYSIAATILCVATKPKNKK